MRLFLPDTDSPRHSQASGAPLLFSPTRKRPRQATPPSRHRGQQHRDRGGRNTGCRRNITNGVRRYTNSYRPESDSHEPWYEHASNRSNPCAPLWVAAHASNPCAMIGCACVKSLRYDWLPLVLINMKKDLLKSTRTIYFTNFFNVE